MEKCYIVWSPEHISNTSREYQLDDYDLDTIEGLLALEKADGSSWSSHVYTSDIDGLLQAFVNETNHTMKYSEVTDIVAYARGSYLTIADAERCGGTYHIATLHNPTDAKIKEVVDVANKALDVVGRDDVAFAIQVGKKKFID